jgi:ABC-type sugar transport system permease subunit
MAELSIARSRAAQRGAVGIRTRSKWLPFWFLMPALLALLAIQVLPTLYSFYLSTTRVRGGVFRDVGLSNRPYLSQ